MSRDNQSSSKMELYIMASGREMYVGVMVFKSGLMEPSTKANGKMERPMVEVRIILLRKVHPCGRGCL